jgi:hypothetical protein
MRFFARPSHGQSDQSLGRFSRDIWGEQKEADRHPFLGAPLGVRRDRPAMLTLTRAMPHCATRFGRFRDALGTGGAPALFPSPSLLAFTNTHHRDRKRDYRIKPPQADESVRCQPDQHRAGKNGA